ncbi:hypothetical protein AJ79_07445 [Helicocarpus griseus UAMH5409]|uniref:Calcineurin-like phosphoesterase domain-containing protein n=1 Tax=Helicocarpus griseus UAMH5409 TaxID=1447875 RepID=A0A2B7X354_9EURO|nr:hypothetical protein AJ79_07445 [Helicocarpus griseus UAMH5409]
MASFRPHRHPQNHALSARLKAKPVPIHSGSDLINNNELDQATMADEEKSFAVTPPRSQSPWREALKSGGNLGSRNLDGPVSSSYPRPTRPLVDYVKNGWMASEPKYSKPGSTMKANSWRARLQVVYALVTAPRFRRYLIVYFFLLWICLGSWIGFLSPRLRESSELSRSLDLKSRERIGGWFGSNALPKFKDLVYIRSLDPALLPGDKELAPDDPNRRRLIFVGDVHGCLEELESLLQKVSFDPQNGDHLVFTGDLISKGPKSTNVVDVARNYHASCVRGNNEDRVLLTRRELKAAAAARSKGRSVDSEPDQADDDVEADYKERILADELSGEQAAWLDACPVILKVGSIKGMGEVVVVHGGLVPGVELENQDPAAVMSMRSVDLLSHVPSASSKGVSWTKLFNKHQSMLSIARQTAPPGESARYSSATTVIYGHDGHPSPSIKKYTKGLDTNCVKGGKLSAMIIEDGGKSRIEDVKCKNYRLKAKKKLKF